MGADLVPTKEDAPTTVRANDARQLLSLDHFIDGIDACSEKRRDFLHRHQLG